MLARLGRWCHDRRGVVVAAWIVALVALTGLSGALGSNFSSQFSLPNVESARGLDIIDARFGGRGSGDGGSIVFQAPDGVNDAAVQAQITQFLDEVGQIPGVVVISPFSPLGQGQVSADGTIAFATLEIPRDLDQAAGRDLADQIEALAPEEGDVRVEFGGQIFQEFEPPSSEALGLAFAIFILIIAFGSVLAMGLPIATAAGGIGLGVAIVGLLSRVITMPDFTTTLGVMIGLGVGIDYALFIVTRYREGLHAGMESSRASAIAINTAGRAVLFAGTTVVISLLGMLLMGVSFVRGLAIGAAITVVATMLASITLLPALLGFARQRVEVTRWRGIIAASLVAVALIGAGLKANILLAALPVAVVVLIAGFFVPPLRKELPRRRPKPVEQTLPYRWSRLIQRRPWPAAIAGVVILVLLALPFLSLRLGFSDLGNDPEERTTRQAYDLLAEGFGPGFNGPLVIVGEPPAGTTQTSLAPITEAIAQTEGVQVVTPAFVDKQDAPTAAIWRVIPTTAPQDAATAELLHRLRDDVLPAATDGRGIDLAVTGNVAVNDDFSTYLGQRLPLFFGVVLLLSFLLLMAVFRSVLVPLKAVIMNLLSIGAAYGVVVMVFQWGWFGDLIGIGGAPIEPFVPMMMFAIVFGLSMDYEVFLLSRVKEEWDRTHDNRRAVADGLASTARVITAAAAIMVFVFGSFLLEVDRVIKLFGVGLATAVFLDATVVRMLLVPATMELLGDRNWWLPRWLDRIIPKIDVEGTGHDTVDELEERTEEVTVSV